MTSVLPVSQHAACDMWAWSECSVSSLDAAIDPSVLCVTAWKHPFFVSSSILSSTALNCSAITGINHRGPIIQLESQSLGGLMLSRDITGGVIVWKLHEPSSALLPRFWGSSSAATLVQLRPCDTFGAAVIMSRAHEQLTGALSFNVTILIDSHNGLAHSTFPQQSTSRLFLPGVSEKETVVNSIKCWKRAPVGFGGSSTLLGCLVDTTSGVWWVSFERDSERWISSDAHLFQDNCIAFSIGLSSHEDCIWCLNSSGCVFRSLCECSDVPAAPPVSRLWAQLQDQHLDRNFVHVYAPDSLSLCIVSGTSIRLLFDCNGTACTVAQGQLPSFPNGMHCWSSCAGSMRICCVYDGHVRICSLGTESIFTQHLVSFTSSGMNLGAVLDDRLYTSSRTGIMRLNIDLKKNISFAAFPRQATKSVSLALEAREAPVYGEDTEDAAGSLSDSNDSENAVPAPAVSDEHSIDTSLLSWIVPWYACLRTKADHVTTVSCHRQPDRVAALTGLLQASSSSVSTGDWMSSTSPQLPPFAAAPVRFTNMKERRANTSMIGAVLSAHVSSGREYMWQSGWFVAWAAAVEEQSQLIDELNQLYEERPSSSKGGASSASSSNMSLSCLSWCGAPLWLSDTSKLSQLLTACGRSM
jgi:hypothetical protein